MEVFNKMVTFKQVMADIKRNQAGIIIGGVIGAIAANYVINQGADLSTIAEAGKGFLDSAMGRTAAPLELAKTKVYVVFVSIGSAIGLVADKLIK